MKIKPKQRVDCILLRWKLGQKPVYSIMTKKQSVEYYDKN